MDKYTPPALTMVEVQNIIRVLREDAVRHEQLLGKSYGIPLSG